MKKRSKKQTKIKTAAELASLLGRSRATVTRWMSDDRWNLGLPPWPRDIVARVEAWAREENESRSKEASELRLLRKQKLEAEIVNAQARSEMDRISIRAREGELVEVARVEKSFMMIQGGVKRMVEYVIQRFGREAAQPMAEEIADMAKRWRDDWGGAR